MFWNINKSVWTVVLVSIKESQWSQCNGVMLVSRRASAQFCCTQLSFLFKSCGLWSLVTSSLTINETLKWLSLLPITMQESFWWWSLQKFTPASCFHGVLYPQKLWIWCFISTETVDMVLYIHRNCGYKAPWKQEAGVNFKESWWCRVKTFALEGYAKLDWAWSSPHMDWWPLHVAC